MNTNRRQFLALVAASAAGAENQVTQPVVSQDACPLERITPAARDGHRGLGFLRKPPSTGRFPGSVIIHGGLSTWPEEQLKTYALSAPTPSRFLAAGYAVLTLTYRSRDHDPQSTVSLEDCLGAINHLRRLPFIDPKSIVVFGCSGGGDLALEIAAATEVCAIVPEEPATVLLTGIFNRNTPRQGERFSPPDAAAFSQNPKLYYTPEYQKITRAKLQKIRCPILIVQGDQQPINRFNAQVLIPELRALGSKFEIITYPGEPHCFCFYGSGPRTPRPAAALKAFQDIDTFCKRYVATKPKPIDPKLIKHTPVRT